jgi:hypothetical protein
MANSHIENGSSLVHSSDAITIMLSDQTGLTGKEGTAYVAGWINESPDKKTRFQMLGAEGEFLDVPSVHPFIVQANQGWQSTGIHISPSKIPVTITYVGGCWTADPHTNHGQPYDAGGCPDVIVSNEQPKYPIVGVNMGALVGRIGDTGSPFFIGRGPFLMPSTFESGELQVCINDDLTAAYGAGLKDNRGSVGVAIFNQGMDFIPVASIKRIVLRTPTNGNERLLFTVSPEKPISLPFYPALVQSLSKIPAPNDPIPAYTVVQYQPAPYLNRPLPEPAGPFDFFEFGYNAAADVSAVNGLGLNLSFTAQGKAFGVKPDVKRSTIAGAYKSFIKNEGAYAAPYLNLLTNGALGANYVPSTVKDEFFAIADPSDMLIAGGDEWADSHFASLVIYWNETLNKFFALNSHISIDLHGDGKNVYTGECTKQELNGHPGGVAAYTLTNGNGNSFTYYQPDQGIESARYVFQQSFDEHQSGGSGGDSGLIQMNIWEALSRGVALEGVTSEKSFHKGFSSHAWNDFGKWYSRDSVCNYYAKFLHYSTLDGKDSRLPGAGAPIFIRNAAYGFSADENPNGKYEGPNVPSKTTGNVGPGSTIEIVVGPW